jgi:hypothetical protein
MVDPQPQRARWAGSHAIHNRSDTWPRRERREPLDLRSVSPTLLGDSGQRRRRTWGAELALEKLDHPCHVGFE